MSPNAMCAKDDWADLFDGFAQVYLMVEPDQAGATLCSTLGDSALRDRLKIVQLDGAKDLSDLHCQDPAAFPQQLEHALARAHTLEDLAAAERDVQRQTHWETCQTLAHSPRILDRLQDSLQHHGVAGEARATDLVYLMMTSRWLARPGSAVLKAPSAAGKSYIVQQTLTYFPARAYYELTAMSDKVLVYGDAPLSHRMLVIYEADGVSSDIQNYFIRSLLSEGRLRYETTEKRPDGSFGTRIIERAGPTGLILTTTKVALHPENETRLFSIPIDDSPEQTRRILLARAQHLGDDRSPLDDWIALQHWLELGEHRVVVPFATALVE